MTMTSTNPRIRNATHRAAPHYECRVVRTVVQDQPELMRPLKLLRDNTENIVNYKKAGELGVTLVMLEPVLRQILAKNRRGAIRREDLSDFEAELNERLEHAQYADYDIPLQDFNQLALYGRHRQYLGLQLHQKDLRLIGDRAVVEQYIRDNYDKPDGESVSKRFLARNLKRMRPHVTLGEVQYQNLTPDQAIQLQDDPTAFMLQEAYGRMEANREEFGMSFESELIEFPEVVSLNGLRVFCQQKA